MTPERWAIVKRILADALDSPVEQREAYLNSACGDDLELRREVDSLIGHSPEETEAPKASEDLTGVTIGPYRILNLLGTGGMGEVYRARDERLDRDVAFKILLPFWIGDSSLVERFNREAKAASALEHPNICRLYDVGQYEGRPFLTMECLQGQTLKDRLKDGPMALDEALPIAAAIAQGLMAAHAKGFIHRDIKPANIFLANSGEVKVLDFGLAKRVVFEDAPTATGLTRTWVRPGTPGYMSPEQQQGGDLDPRTDVYSFGVLLRNMRVPEFADIAARATQSNRDSRYQSAAEMFDAVQALRRPPVKKDWMWLWLVAMVAIAFTLAFYWFSVWRGGFKGPASVAVPFLSVAGTKDSPVFSPSGTQVAFSWRGDDGNNTDIYVMPVAPGSQPRRVTTNPAPDRSPAWSPDGKSLAFFREGDSGGYFIVPVSGEGERKVADLYSPPIRMGGRTLDWSPDGQSLAIADRMTADTPPVIYLLDLKSGQKRKLLEGQFVNAPTFSPDGKRLAYLAGPSFLAHDLFVIPIGGGVAQQLTSDRHWLAGLTWARGGRDIVFSSNRAGLFNMWRVPSSGGNIEPVPAAGSDATSPAIAGGQYEDRLAYVRRRINVNIWRLPLDPPGEPRRLLASTRSTAEPAFSPDGHRIAYASDRTGAWEIFLSDENGANTVQLTMLNGPQSGSPSWSPDARFVAFDSRPDGHSDIFVMPVAGGKMQRLTTASSDDYLPVWSRDGKSIYFISNRSGGHEVWKMAAYGGPAERITSTGADAVLGESEDGRIYYVFHEALYRTPNEKLIDSLHWHDVAISSKGIFFASKEVKSMQTIERLTLPGGQRATVATIGPRANRAGPIVVSPDAKWLLYDRVDSTDIEIMILNRFR